MEGERYPSSRDVGESRRALRLLTPQSRGWLCSCGRVALRLCASRSLCPPRAVERTCAVVPWVDALLGVLSTPRLIPPATLFHCDSFPLRLIARSPTGNSAGAWHDGLEDELGALALSPPDDGTPDESSAGAESLCHRAAAGTSGGTSAGTAAAAASDDSRSVAPFRVGTDCSGAGLHDRISINGHGPCGWMRKRLLLNGLAVLLCLVAQLVSEWPVLRQEPLQTAPLSSRSDPSGDGCSGRSVCVCRAVCVRRAVCVERNRCTEIEVYYKGECAHRESETGERRVHRNRGIL